MISIVPAKAAPLQKRENEWMRYVENHVESVNNF